MNFDVRVLKYFPECPSVVQSKFALRGYSFNVQDNNDYCVFCANNIQYSICCTFAHIENSDPT